MTQAYEGPDRRAQHCAMHEDNSKDIASLKSSFGTLRWIVGLTMPLIIGIVGFSASAVSSHLTRLNTTMDDLKNTIQTKSENDAGLRVRVEFLERQINALLTTHNK